MSKNIGNTGQRFTKPRVRNVKLHGGDIVIELECGHSYSYTPVFDKERAYWEAQGRMRAGTRARCNQCKAMP